MSTYRDDRDALATRISALEAELAGLEPQLAEAEAEAERLASKERELEAELGRLTAPGPTKNRTDRILGTIVYVPLASALGGALAMCAGLLVIGLPTFLFTDNPGNWLLYLVGVVAVAGLVTAGVHTVRQIWGPSA